MEQLCEQRRLRHDHGGDQHRYSQAGQRRDLRSDRTEQLCKKHGLQHGHGGDQHRRDLSADE